MTEELAPSSRHNRTLCLPISKEKYAKIIADSIQSRKWIDDCYQQMPELFLSDFSLAYQYERYLLFT